MAAPTSRHRRGVLAVNGLKGTIALLFLARPAVLAPWVGSTADIPGGRVLLRAFGVRDLGLALGAIAAAPGDPRRNWLLAGGVSDLLDAAATTREARAGRDGLGPMAMLTSCWAAASGLACLALAATEPRR